METRKNILEYDEIISVQREMIYTARNNVMKGSDHFLDSIIQQAIKKTVDLYVFKKANLNRSKMIDFIYNNISYTFQACGMDQEVKVFNQKSIRNYLRKLIQEQIKQTEHKIPDRYQLLYFKRLIILKAIDTMWIEQSDNLQQLKSVVNGRSWGQHKPIYEFQLEARRSFFEMKDGIWLNILRNFLLADLVDNSDGSIQVDFP